MNSIRPILCYPLTQYCSKRLIINSFLKHRSFLCYILENIACYSTIDLYVCTWKFLYILLYYIKPMNTKILFVAIGIVAAFGIVATVGLATLTPVSAIQHLGNMTAGNMTGGNMTAGNMTAGNLTG